MHPTFGLSTPILLRGREAGAVSEIGWEAGGRRELSLLGVVVEYIRPWWCGLWAGVEIDFTGVFWGVGTFFGGGWCGYTGKIFLPLYGR